MNSTGVQDHTDGRTARRDRNRELVLDAAIELFAEGLLIPGALEVADRSGVSLRSVYRYFDDMGELIRAAIARQQERSTGVWALEGPGEGPVEDRIARIVEQRIRIHGALAPVFRATFAHQHESAALRARVAAVQAMASDQVQQMFAPELGTLPEPKSGELLAALDILLGFGSFEHLFVFKEFSVDEARSMLIGSLTALLAIAEA